MDHEKNENQDNANISITRKTVYIAIAIIIVVGLGISFLLGVFDSPTEVADEPEVVDELEQVDEMDEVENGEVIATVNGEEVTRAEFNQALEQEKMQYQMQGIDLESEEMADMVGELEEQVLDNYFIIPLILQQKAEEVGTEINEEEIEDRYQQYVAEFGGEEALEEQMEMAGLDREELEKEIVKELSLQKYLDNYMDEYLEENPDERIAVEEVDLSDEEVEDRYQQILEAYNELTELMEEDDPEMPKEQVEMQMSQIEQQYSDVLETDDFEEAKPIIEDEMREGEVAAERQEKQQRVYMAHIEDLRDEFDIDIKASDLGMEK